MPADTLSQLYLAESEKAGAMMVIKVTPSVHDEKGVDQSFERFLQEYEIAHRLHHPSIVRCHELGVADDHAYLAMEYFPEGDLRRRIRAGVTAAECAGTWPRRWLARWRPCTKPATLHRDLKPGNVLMRSADRIALTDFGLAKHAALEADITDPGMIFGTPHYMSPEQGHGETVDERSDLYSLGVILYEMLTGEKPFTDPNPMAIIYKHRHQPIPRLPRGRPPPWQELRRCPAGKAARRPLRHGRTGRRRMLRAAALRASQVRRLMLQAATPAGWVDAAALAGGTCWSIMPTARRKPPPRRWR